MPAISAYTVTLTSANTNYNLDTLVRAIASTERSNFNKVILQADSANADSVLVGDANLATTRYGTELASSDVLENEGQSGANDQTTCGLYLRSAAALQKVHVTLVVA